MYYGNHNTLPSPTSVSTNDWPENYCTFHGLSSYPQVLPAQGTPASNLNETDLDIAYYDGPSVIYGSSGLQDFTMSAFFNFDDSSDNYVLYFMAFKNIL